MDIHKQNIINKYTKKEKNKLYQKSLIFYGPLFHKQINYIEELQIFYQNKKLQVNSVIQEQILNLVLLLKQKKCETIIELNKFDNLIVQNFYNTSDIQKVLTFEQFISPQLDIQQFKNYVLLGKYKKYNQYYSIIEEKEQKGNELIEKGQCIIDDQVYTVNNYRIPFGIYMGKPNSKLNGMYRQEIYPKNVTINCTNKLVLKKGIEIKQINDQYSQYLATWYDEIQKKFIYTRTERISQVIQENTQQKFVFAQYVANNQQKILDALQKLLEQDQIQMFCLVYIIYKFGIRIGSHDLNNGVIGASQLKKENIQLIEEKNNEYFVQIKFIGKDAVLYNQKKNINNKIYDIFKRLLNGLKKDQNIFDISAQQLNNYLDSIIKGLSGKVFRTMRSSIIFDYYVQKIKKENEKENKKENEKENKKNILFQLKKAFYKVALFCNHVLQNKESKEKREEKKKKIMEKIEKKEKTEKTEKTDQQKEMLLFKLEQLNSDYKISISTSKQNYIDPRIVLSFCLYFNIDITEVYNKQELKTHNWIFDQNIDSHFMYNTF